MAKIALVDVGSGYQTATQQNANNDTLETHLNDKVLYRDNPSGEANTMQQELDMNSNQISNVTTPNADQDAATKGYVDSLLSGTTDTGSAQLRSDIASTTTSEGASLVGIEDAGGYITATTVEGALQELFSVGGTNVTTNAVQTLTNKTLTAPLISALQLLDSSIIFEGATADAFETTLSATDPTADRVITLQDSTHTLVGIDTTDTLTNKTLTAPTIGDASNIVSASESVEGVLELATNTEALAGSDSTRAVTSAGLASSKNLATKGYYKLPGGLVIQWGTDGALSPASITFDTAYATACLGVVATTTSNITRITATGSLTTTGFTLYKKTAAGADSTVGVFWIALGY